MSPGPLQKCSRLMRRNTYGSIITRIMGAFVADLLSPPQPNELALYRSSDVMADGGILLHGSVITV